MKIVINETTFYFAYAYYNYNYLSKIFRIVDSNRYEQVFIINISNKTLITYDDVLAKTIKFDDNSKCIMNSNSKRFKVRTYSEFIHILSKTKKLPFSIVCA